MSGRDRVGILVARVVEMYDLLQAFEVAVVKEHLLEVGSGGFGGGTLCRCQRYVAPFCYLLLAVDSRRILFPTHFCIRAGSEAASEYGPKSYVTVADAIRVCRDS